MAKQQGPGNGSLNKDRRVQAEKHPPNKGRQMNQGRLQPNRPITGSRQTAAARPANAKRTASSVRPQTARERYPVRRSPAVQNDRDERESTEKKKGGKVQRFYDYSLLLTIIFLTIFGLVMIYSSSSYSAQIRFHDAGHFMKRQGYIALGSFVVMLIVSKMDYHFYAKFAYLADRKSVV